MLTPAFEIGLWNAWIFMLYILLTVLVVAKMKKGEAPKNELDALSKTEKRIFNFSKVVFLSAVIYSIFLPLKLWTIWFYIGLPICLLGLIMFTIAIVNIANIPLDEPFTKGLYRYSRHPMYVTWFLTLIGVGIASASWIFLLFSILSTTLSFVLAIPEERLCLKKYGNAYREYMNRTPRWVGVPKSGESD